MSRVLNLNRHEWLLLSAYLDGELSDREKRQVEEWLQQDPARRTALEGLRHTRQVLRYAPQRSVPHNFTLTPDMLRKPLLPSFSRMFSYSTALAGILLAAVLGLDLFSNMGRAPVARNAAEPMMESYKAAEDMAAATTEQAAPQIIYWGYSGPFLGAYGKGGGGGDGSGMAYGIGGGGGGAPIGGGVETAPPVAQEQLPLEEAAPLAEEAPATVEQLPEASLMQPEQNAPAEESLPQATLMPAAPAAENLAGVAPDAGTGELGSSPILGIRPAEQQGSFTPQTRVQTYPISQEKAPLPFRTVEWVLAGLLLLSGLAAFLLREFSA
jgi:hypothetical protein